MYDIVTFLTFDGTAEAAIDFYRTLFDDTEVLEMHRYGPDEAGPEGTLEHATFRLHGQEYMALDSAMKHPDNLPSTVAMFIPCQTEAELDALYAKLSDGGEVTLALGRYPFSDRFCALLDRFGVAWQLSLEP
jgi:predicted 3-demethylubiquinone-9 3-methyltransferase (glyoxalase superfamily)